MKQALFRRRPIYPKLNKGSMIVVKCQCLDHQLGTPIQRQSRKIRCPYNPNPETDCDIERYYPAQSHHERYVRARAGSERISWISAACRFSGVPTGQVYWSRMVYEDGVGINGSMHD